MQPDFVSTKKKTLTKTKNKKKTSESLWRIITLELVSIDILYMDGLGFVETDEILPNQQQDFHAGGVQHGNV